ncbi:Wadjet anti-phage system protein JetD domain-containing protein [Catellatospora sp. TT07R-123]|uniref:Wadjet anti-phage system protein JetD domain-containing protein n=1 Tax=Catellatospora sp. TT07R-123 TaxID=2733863 RepID=UPI001BB368D1|nr:Wadjet anti-phage system protein JetD domain-containing protein [Catellatospora sp. TT07R-123]
MRDPDEITALVRQRFAAVYPDWARGLGTWPMRLSLQPPDTRARSEDPVACHEWAQRWADYTGPGEIIYANARFPTGVHALPQTLVFGQPHDVAAADFDTAQTWRRCGRRLVQLQRAFPDADFTGIIRRITELPETDFARLVNAVTWLKANPASGMLLRQLPIEGIDTKWLARHTQLVVNLLGHGGGQTDPESAAPAATRRLHQRLGLRTPPELIQVVVCDPALRENLGGMRHLATAVDDLNRWLKQPDVVLIIENKESAYAFTDDMPGTVILHGQGFSVANYGKIHWVKAARKVLYWGDIDGPGLVFLNDLRGHGVDATSILMDCETLDRFRHLAVDGTAPDRRNPDRLTPGERELYLHLTAYAAERDRGLLLEQERIPWHFAHGHVAMAMSRD